MVHRSAAPQPWPDCLLAVAPGLLYVIATGAQIIGAGREYRPFLFLLATVVAIAFAAGILRAGRLPTWALAGIGLTVPALFAAGWGLAFPAPSQSPQPPPDLELANALLPAVLLFIYAALLWAAMRRARAVGPAAALLLVGPVTLLAFAVMDPTYGFFLYVESLFMAAALEAFILLPALVLLPICILRAGSQRGQARCLLALSALSLELMALAPLVTAVARVQQGVLNAPPLAEAVPYTLLVGTAFAVFFWGLLALTVLLTLRIGKQHSPRNSSHALAHVRPPRP